MARRFKHKARAACPLAPTGVTCHAFGIETGCRLCALVDLDHAVSAATLGRMDAPDRWQASEDAFWAHLARRTDGGPVTPPQLVTWLERRREQSARRALKQVRRAVIEHSDLPDDAPF